MLPIYFIFDTTTEAAEDCAKRNQVNPVANYTVKKSAKGQTFQVVRSVDLEALVNAGR